MASPPVGGSAIGATSAGVGLGEGDAIGSGVAVGAGVGVAVGAGVGLAVEAGVGLAVGAGVGLAVGAGVGVAVGVGVGLAVGVGVGVGEGVGVGVGEGVGEGVAVGQTSPSGSASPARSGPIRQPVPESTVASDTAPLSSPTDAAYVAACVKRTIVARAMNATTPINVART